MFRILLFAFLANFVFEKSTSEISEQNLSKEVQIGAFTKGYDRVGLRCGAETMLVELRTTDDFSGVIYTQGNFHSREPPCFLDPIQGRSFTMNIPLNKCETEQDGDRYSNIVVVQHDDELVTPGDAAFVLECDFSKPRNLTVTANLNGKKTRRAKWSISLVDADPGRHRNKRAILSESKNEEVTFEPKVFRKRKEEL